ncbi:putative RNA-directed DNA polymerase from transposon BS [Nosema granulosis]|uniref:RNA-directed DNA polymerase from transposon BS n=1 Tax=Nosema granulosis TaxID=83296 RepID=A0A9P6KXQ3_9MICR|nr:putative RNA-directed DNA polymerase from transposon BS [Nosema granulosis]
MEGIRELNITGIAGVNEKCEQFAKMMFNAYNISCPVAVKRLSVKRALSPWITKELLNCISRKHELYRLSKEDASFKDEYKEYRNSLSSSINYAKKHYYVTKFTSCINNAKKTWKAINEILGQKSKNSNVAKISVGGTVTEDPSIIADEFNRHYVSIADKLSRDIPGSNKNPTEYVMRSIFSFVYFPTDESEMVTIINSFKSKNCNLDSIPSFMYKHVSDIVSPVIALLINSSFEEGIFPDVLKISRVLPIYKAGPRDKVINYRPISILDFLEKKFERTLCNRLMKFFKKYNTICDQQFGFRQGRSTSDAILQYSESIYSAYDASEYVISVMLDLSKAFDTVDHTIHTIPCIPCR